MKALLDAIADRPTEDAPRLVYADWLNEQGNPRGEFIHLQIALENLRYGDPKSGALRVRAEELLRLHRSEWEPKVNAPGTFGWGFSRGFPSRVEAGAQILVTAASAIVDEVPTVNAALAMRFNVHPETFLALPLIPKINALSLNYLAALPTSRDILLRVLLNDSRVQHLRHLCISYTFLTFAEWEAIVGSTLLPRLDGLDLSLGHATDQSVALLMSLRSTLTSLSLASCRIGTGGTRAIANSPNASRLEHLNLGWNRVGVKGARALSESPHLDRLEYLDLSHCQIGDEGCEALAKGNLTSLRVLMLEHCRITDRGAKLLCESPALANLVFLQLKDNAISPDTLSVLKTRFGQRK